MRHTVVISDIHLCEVEREDGLWMRYRQRPFLPDAELAEMLAAVREQARGEALTLVLNGDVFDLDAPRVVDDKSVFHDHPRDADHAVPSMRAILDDHPVFIEALGRVLAEGHEVVLISGNHDVQLTLPEVRALVRERLVKAAEAAGGEAVEAKGAIEARIKFRSWFHKTADGIVIEHGNQYDGYCSFRHPMAPFGKGRRAIQPTLGSLAARNLVGRMGYFNPHVDSSFMLSTIGYLAHWARYYLFSRRSLAFAWAKGALRTFLELVRAREHVSRARRRADIAACARETGAKVRAIARHARIFARPAEERLHRVARELWIDRAALSFALLAVTTLWFALAKGPLLVGAAIAPALFLGYELIVPKVPLDENWRAVQRASRKVAKIHGASAVVFGHTHHPEGAWEQGIFYGNTGSWSAAFQDLACTRPLDDARPVVWLRRAAEGAKLTGGLMKWKKGRFAEGS